MGGLAGRLAVVTGAGSGIGAVAAAHFAAEGASVVVADLNVDAAEAVADGIRAGGGIAVAVGFDLGDVDSIAVLMESAVRAFGGIDVLLNNAAATHLAGERDVPIALADHDLWNESFRVNVTGTMSCIKAAVPYMAPRGGGSIVNVASGAGLAGDIGHPAYGASKAAIIRMTTYAAIEFGPKQIRCNAIAPGLIVTPATEDTWAAGPMRDIMVRQHLTRRLGTPSDIASAAAFLASDESSFITGQVLCVDGGLLSHMPYVADLMDLMAGN
ncbi:glucose 1-dehydrogenase [Mycolicibacterium fluoranthenivorans]|uniref:Glucose 1-dehydrogenase n=1 Tax=Mycolicibacterium fluoranthenivorans TaxID=258505 RepID=A0A7G8PG48_9MYCO|nr:glucose 1-dehydrogenase [Mycolicibacterium fluoranthenivorans]QNJ93314.1 glucose 1-dehydrogenase [Mycolicibacterium fluoranthenivorans]